MAAGAAFICAFFLFFKASQLEHFFCNVEREMGMQMGFLTFVYVPIPDPPLE